jgi:hypothetical protein
MLEFINHNSFLLLMVIVWVTVTLVVYKKRRKRNRYLLIVIMTAFLLVSYLVILPEQGTSSELEEIQTLIGKGTPVLIEFQSRY